MVYATYNEYGYEIIVNNDNDNGPVEEYQAANSSLDSAQGVSLDSPWCLPLDTIREHAEQTGKDMAEEHDTTFCGAEYQEQD